MIEPTRFPTDDRGVVAAITAVADRLEAHDAWDMQNVAVRADHDRIVALLDQAAQALGSPDMDRLMRRVALRDRLISLNARLHDVTERALARKALAAAAGRDPFEGSWINRGFTELLAGQIAQWQRCGALGSLGARIAIVGGGALPQTQAYLARALGCDTISIERDPEAVELSREVLSRAGIGNATVVLADGRHYDFAGCSIIVVATLVQCKSAIAHQVAQTAPGAIFAPRTAVGTHAMWREAVDEASVASAGWQLLDIWSPAGSTVASHAYRQHVP